MASDNSASSSSLSRVRDCVHNSNSHRGIGGTHTGLGVFDPQQHSTQNPGTFVGRSHLTEPKEQLIPTRQSQTTFGRTFSVRELPSSFARLAVPAVDVNDRHHSPSRNRQEPFRQQDPTLCTVRDSYAHEPTPSHFQRSRKQERFLGEYDDPCPLTKKQLAARQAISKDLPSFSGNPEEWPIFFSSYTNTTAMCGFTDAENVIRLQKSLTGKAYDAVKSRLMHPSNVEGVIATLRMRFG